MTQWPRLTCSSKQCIMHAPAHTRAQKTMAMNTFGSDWNVLAESGYLDIVFGRILVESFVDVVGWHVASKTGPVLLECRFRFNSQVVRMRTEGRLRME